MELPEASGSAGPRQPSRAASLSTAEEEDKIPNAAATPESTSVLGSYPFIQYTPSSRVARHMSSLQLEQPPPPSTNELYPQHVDDLQRLESSSGDDSGFVRANHMKALRLLEEFGSSRVDKEAIAEALSTSQTGSNGLSTPTFRHNPMSITPRTIPRPVPESSGSIPSSSFLEFMIPLAPTFVPTPTHEPKTEGEATRFLDKYIDNVTQHRLAEEENKRNKLAASADIRMTSASPGVMMDGSSPDPLGWTASPLKRKRNILANGQHEHSPTKPSGLARSISSAALGQDSSNSRRLAPLPPLDHSQSDQRPAVGGSPRMQAYVEIPVCSPGGPRTRSRSPTKKGGARRVLYKDEDDEMSDQDSNEDEADYAEAPVQPMQRLKTEMDAQGRPRTPFASSSMRNVVAGSSQSKLDLEQRLTSLIENIFEAEDSLPADVASEDLEANKYFFIESDDARNKIRLETKVIAELSLLAEKIAIRSGGHKSGSSGVMGKGKGKEKARTDGWEDLDIKRLLDLLQRSFVGSDSISVFPKDGFGGLNFNASPSKGKAKGKKATKSSPVKQESTDDGLRLSADSLNRCKRDLEKLARGVASAECCLALLATGGLPKRLYSEDLISCCLIELDAAMIEAIYPVLDALGDPSTVDSTLLAVTIQGESQAGSSLRRRMEVLVRRSRSHLACIRRLLERPEMALSDGTLSKAVFLTLRLISSHEGTGEKMPTSRQAVLKELFGDKSGAQFLRLTAMSLLKTLYACSAGHSEWILQEILQSVEKFFSSKRGEGQQRLREGKSINAASALLLDLIQGCARGARTAHVTAKSGGDAASQHQADTQAEIDGAPTNILAIERQFATHLDLASKTALQIGRHLLHKASGVSGIAGRGKTSADAESKNVLDTYISDQLTVLNLPEWPAAALSLEILSRIMIHAIDSQKQSGESPLARQIAIEHLSSIAAKLRGASTTMKEMKQGPAESEDDLTLFQQRCEGHHTLISYLAREGGQDQAMQGGLELGLCLWVQELSHARIELVATIAQDRQAAPRDGMGSSRLEQNLALERAIQEEILASKADTNDETMFDAIAPDQIKAMQDLSLTLQAKGRLASAFEAVFQTVLSALDSNVVGLRTKALRGLVGVIVTDPDVLLRNDVQTALRDRFSDTSPQVRDVAVELVSKYLLLRPDLASTYYPLISSRSTDSGLSVRKRVINLLRSMYTLLDDKAFKVDICCRLINMFLDEDEGIKDLAIHTICDFWFPGIASHAKKGPEVSVTPTSPADTADMMLEVVTTIPDSIYPLVRVMKQWTTESPERSAAEYAGLADYLHDSLVDDAEQSSSVSKSLNWMRTMYLLTQASPGIVTINKATALLRYVRNLSSTEDYLVAELVLKIFRLSIPNMPKTATTFATDLSAALLPMIGKPSGRLSVLQEAVGCYGCVVTYMTNDYNRVLSILKSCTGKLRMELDRIRSGTPVSDQLQKTLPFYMHIATLLVAHCNIDEVKKTNATLFTDVIAITTSHIVDHMHDLLLGYWELGATVTIRNTVLTCLGFLYGQYPSLILTPAATVVIDSVLDGTHPQAEQLRPPLLRAIYDVLCSEVEKHPPPQNAGKIKQPLDMDELIGITSGFGESGLSSAIAQRFSESFLALVLSNDPEICGPAFDLLALSVSQGWGHPLQAVPALVGLETCLDSAKADKALGLHSYLVTRHGEMLNTRQLDCARKAFRYQQLIDPEPEGVYHFAPPKPLLHRWYTLISEKRVWRQDFLKNLCRAFELEASETATSRDDVAFARFLADNLALLEYRTLDEIMLVIAQMTSVLSVAGMHVFQSMRKGRMVNERQMVIRDDMLNEDDEDMEESVDARLDAFPVGNQSLIVGMALLLKDRLKKTYSLSEDKCTKFNASKKTGNEKAPVRKSDGAAGCIDWDVLPGIQSPIDTVEAFKAQQVAFVELMEQDGLYDEQEEE